MLPFLEMISLDLKFEFCSSDDIEEFWNQKCCLSNSLFSAPKKF